MPIYTGAPLKAYDPESWLVTLLRGVEAYAKWGIQNYDPDANWLYHPTDNPNGIFEVVMGWPHDVGTTRKVPLERNLIHFEVDDVDGNPMGFGDNVFNWNYDPQSETVTPQEAQSHRVNFDIGIWTSAKSGGTTYRAIARQMLDEFFLGPRAIRSLMAATDAGNGGLEIMNFTGGRFLTETINDVPTYRGAEATLEVRCYSRTRIAPADALQAIEEISQSPGLTIEP